ncbi:MAG: phytoene desaturase [Bacteroidetes bacterium]|nr:MAG: phytoene desaturase [Bacteroidota bacterium]
MNKSTAIVIGAGVGGLASAIRLAAKGYAVQVFERNAYPGGKLSAFQQQGYLFDAGPSLFTQPQNIEELFALCNQPMAAYFKYQSVPVACQYFFANGKQLTAHANAQRLAANMHIQLGENAEAVINYLSRAQNAYQHIGEFFLNNSLHRLKTYLNTALLKALWHTRLGYLTKSLNRFNTRAFRTPEAVQLFNRYATYNGSNPYKAPAMLSMIPHLEMNEGTFYPNGGMISITNALVALATKMGVQFHFSTPVLAINRQQGQVQGVQTAQGNHVAALVVSNGDVYFTYKHLLNQPALAAKLLKQERSSSALIFYWGVKHSFEQLQLHNIFFTADYKQEFDCIFKKGTVAADPTVYINITSKMEANQAPAGCENWFVMVNVPAHKQQDWAVLQQQVRKAVIAKLSRVLAVNLESLIATEAILNPIMIEERTASYRGSLYGTSSNSPLAAFFRHANFTKRIRGLYFVGGSVHPGGGIPLCLKSAKIMAEMVPAPES